MCASSQAPASRRGIKFIETYDPSLPHVHGNRDQLIQVLLNLVKNAAESIAGMDRPDGEIHLSTGFQHGVRLSASSGRPRANLPIFVAVRDNGPGIPEDIRRHLFEPFISTKATGSGLGLALVAKIVADHGGLIDVDSRARPHRIPHPSAGVRRTPRK